MNCHEVMDDMQRQLDGDLSEHETDRLTEHIEQCAACSEVYERLQRLSFELENLPKVTPAYSLVDAILPELKRIDAEGSGLEPAAASEIAAPRRAKPRSRWTDRFSYRALAGAVAAGVVAGIFLITYPGQSSQDGTIAMERAAQSTASESANSSAAETGSASDETAGILSEPAAGSSGGAAPKVQAGAGDDAGAYKFEVAEQAGSAESKSADTSKADPDKAHTSKADTDMADAPSLHKDDGKSKNAPLAADSERVTNDGASGKGKVAEKYQAPLAAPEPTKDPNKGAPDQGVAGSENGQVEEPAATGGSIASVSEESVSPDQAFLARIADGKLTVFDSATGDLVYETGPKTGTLAFVAWSEYGKKLEYAETLEGGGEQRFLIDLVKKEEVPVSAE